MSYSFSVRGATKAEAMQKVVAELDKVVASQPIHSADRAQAEAAACGFLSVIPDDAGGKDFYISVSGSVSWSGTLDVDAVVKSASVNVSASLLDKASA
jgi:hypothetical protein